VLLSSDGLHSYVDDIGIADCVRNVPEPTACAVALHDRALARSSDDNITALIARCDELVDVPEEEDDDRTIVPV
jgi:serine/threonine protein phosphatase PrpC